MSALDRYFRVTERGREVVSVAMWVASLAFLVYFLDPWLRQFIK